MFLRLSVLFCLALSLSACGGGSGSASSNQNASGSHAVVVTRVSPSNLNSATSPVNFDFKASSQTPIKGWTITVDSKQVYQTGSTSELQTSLAIAAGTHQVGVNASNSNGTIGSSNFALTVVSGSPTPTPTPTPNPSPTPTPTPNPSPTPTPTPSPTPTPAPITVSISPTSVTLQPSQSAQFSATVSGTSNTGVTWLVNGTPGGSSSTGTISSLGAYQAPPTSTAMQVTVTAQSVANPAVSASAAVTVKVTTGLNFYVAPGGSDSNDGSGAHPWATIQHAADNAQPGAIIHVAPGTYSVVTSNVAGTATARIKFISDVQWAAKISIAGTPAGWHNNANYVDIEGFDISGRGRVGIANSASFVRMIGNHIHNVFGGTCDNSGGAAIDNDNFSGQDNDVIANVINDIGPTPLGSCAFIQGIYYENLRGHIYNNVVYRVSAWGIHLWHAATNVIISSNLVFNNGSPAQGGGIVVGDGDAPGGVIDDFTNVTNNIVMHNGGPGIVEEGAVGTHNVFSHNIVYQNSIDFQLIGTSDVGTLHVDPQLVNYQPDGSGDYHLTAASPAVDAGTTLGAPGNDFDGGVRPIGSGYDIGPYEFNSPPATWPFE